MKAQNKEEKQAKQQEREKLQREIAAREKAEKQKDEYEQRMREMKAEMEAKQVSKLLPGHTRCCLVTHQTVMSRLQDWGVRLVNFVCMNS